MRDQVIGVLALKSDASDEDVVKVVREDREKARRAEAAEGTVAAVCKAIDLPDGSSPTAIESKLAVLSKRAAEADDLQAQLGEATKKTVEQEADKLIAAAKKDGKLVESEEAWARALILKGDDGVTAFKNWLEVTPVKRQQGQTTPPADDGKTGGGERGSLINSAAREYDDNRRSIVCSLVEFINETLREKGQPPLSEDESKQHETVA